MRRQRICDLCNEEREIARCAVAQGGDEVNEMIEVIEGTNRTEMWGLCFEWDAGEDVYQRAGDIKDFFNLDFELSHVDFLATAWRKNLPGRCHEPPLIVSTADL